MFVAKPFHRKNYLTSTFQAFLCAKFLITLSKSTRPAMLDSMFCLVRSTSRVCDIVDCKLFVVSLSLLKDRLADATVSAINNVIKLIQAFGNYSHNLIIIIIIIMVIFKCYFSGELIALSYKKKYRKQQQRCEHRIRKNKQIKSTVHDANKKMK